MGIKDLSIHRLSLDEILAELPDEDAEILRSALCRRKNAGTSRFFHRSGTEIARALAEDGYAMSRDEIGEWRRQHADQ